MGKDGIANSVFRGYAGSAVEIRKIQANWITEMAAIPGIGLKTST
jgi:hypothetical protein